MNEKRRDPRLGIRLEVELQSEGESASLHTRDLSSKGVYVEAEQRQFPEVGSIVYIRLKQGFQEGEEAPLVKAEVVRADNDGFALKFLDS